MSLLFNMLSRLVIFFLPMSKLLLISWLQSPSAVVLEPSAPKTPSAVFVVRSSIYLRDSDPSPPLFPTDIRCLQELVWMLPHCIILSALWAHQLQNYVKVRSTTLTRHIKCRSIIFLLTLSNALSELIISIPLLHISSLYHLKSSFCCRNYFKTTISHSSLAEYILLRIKVIEKSPWLHKSPLLVLLNSLVVDYKESGALPLTPVEQKRCLLWILIYRIHYWVPLKALWTLMEIRGENDSSNVWSGFKRSMVIYFSS